MDGNIEALQELYVALGGSLIDTYEGIAGGIPVRDYTIIPDMIEAISERAKSAGIELPAVTKDDTGSVLMVNSNGVWDVGQVDVDVANGAKVHVVDGLKRSSQFIAVTKGGLDLDVSSLSVGDYLCAESDISASLTDGRDTYTYTLAKGFYKIIDATGMGSVYVISNFNSTTTLPNNNTHISNKIVGLEEDFASLIERIYEPPTVTASDNGDVLGVVNGTWAKMTPATYEPFVVEFTDDTGTGATCNHTFAEIRNAFVNGIISNIIYKSTVDNYYMQNGSCGCDSGETTSITFFFPQYLDNFSNPTSLNLYCVKIDSTNTVSETWKSVALS